MKHLLNILTLALSAIQQLRRQRGAAASKQMGDTFLGQSGHSNEF
jgi:hypothetical protein